MIPPLPYQVATALCAVCRKATCQHSDLEFAGLIPFSSGRTEKAGDCPHDSTGHPRSPARTPLANLPEPHRTPRISGSGFRLSPFDHGDTYVRN